MMQAHYTSILDLSDEALQAAEKGYTRLMDALDLMDDLPVSSSSGLDIEGWRQRCYDAMNDDFNSPVLIAHLFEGVKWIHLIREGKQTIDAAGKVLFQDTVQAFVFDVLGIETAHAESGETEKLDGVVQLLIEMRNKARADKDYATSDEIRDTLSSLGIQLKDGKEGTTYSL